MYCLRDRFSPYSSDNIRSSCLAEPQSIAQSSERELQSGLCQDSTGAEELKPMTLKTEEYSPN